MATVRAAAPAIRALFILELPFIEAVELVPLYTGAI
jgi:hypothetical protein